MDNGDVEVNSLDVEHSGETFTVSLDFRHTRCCANCLTELKEIYENETLGVKLEDFSKWADLKEDAREAIKAALLAGDAEVSIDEDSTDSNEGGNMITVEVSFTITAKAGDYEVQHIGTINSKHAADEYGECY